jgi:hypothetical protein
MVYPSRRAIEILGGNSPALNQALECWAGQLARAISDNAKKFSQAWEEDFGTVIHIQPLHQWAILAESLKGKKFDSDYPRPGELVAAAVEDAERYESIRVKHSLNPFDYGCDEGKKAADSAWTKDLDALCTELRRLDFVHAWALISTIDWYWANHSKIDPKKDQWWQLWYRLALERETENQRDEKRRKKVPRGAKAS